jgi:hypothetical protein
MIRFYFFVKIIINYLNFNNEKGKQRADADVFYDFFSFRLYNLNFLLCYFFMIRIYFFGKIIIIIIINYLNFNNEKGKQRADADVIVVASAFENSTYWHTKVPLEIPKNKTNNLNDRGIRGPRNKEDAAKDHKIII